ncbi:MAG: SIS domain-containing protein, partial [bacterium]
MNPTETYYDAIAGILREIKEKEMANIKKAADLISEKIMNDEVVWAFGTGGHSIMGAMELFT